MAWYLTVAVDGGYRKVWKNMSELCNKIRSSAPLKERVFIAFKPSIQSQLDDSSVYGWNKVCSCLYSNLGTKYNLTVQFLEPDQATEVIDFTKESSNFEDVNENRLYTDKIYKHVCMGGTFDRIHAGHKILLSTALIRCKDSLTVGVAGPQLLGKKTLTEMIEPLEDRIKNVETFLTKVNRNVDLKVCEIKDPYGPAIVDPLLECIVASRETEKGCDAINEKRKEKALTKLDVHCIELVEDPNRRGDHEEEKISSSSMRSRLLGERLRPAIQIWDRSKGPYIIGLTGGSASGKSSVGRRFQGLGAGLVDCDKLGHAAYSAGSTTLDKIVKQFGNNVLLEDGNINRKVLGSIVFSDKNQLQKLNDIVWPEISKMANKQAEQLYADGHSVVILDAAVLLEAGWDKNCHEVWVCTVPRETAIERIMERDNKTRKEAENRLDSQMLNENRCKGANSIFCTLWDPEVTQEQVENAWKRLMKDLSL